MKNPFDQFANEIVFKIPASAMISFRPGIHYSLPVPRCVCGGILDDNDFCASCNKWLFDE